MDVQADYKNYLHVEYDVFGIDDVEQFAADLVEFIEEHGGHTVGIVDKREG